MTYILVLKVTLIFHIQYGTTKFEVFRGSNWEHLAIIVFAQMNE